MSSAALATQAHLLAIYSCSDCGLHLQGRINVALDKTQPWIRPKEGALAEAGLLCR